LKFSLQAASRNFLIRPHIIKIGLGEEDGKSRLYSKGPGSSPVAVPLNTVTNFPFYIRHFSGGL